MLQHSSVEKPERKSWYETRPHVYPTAKDSTRISWLQSSNPDREITEIDISLIAKDEEKRKSLRQSQIRRASQADVLLEEYLSASNPKRMSRMKDAAVTVTVTEEIPPVDRKRFSHVQKRNSQVVSVEVEPPQMKDSKRLSQLDNSLSEKLQRPSPVHEGSRKINHVPIDVFDNDVFGPQAPTPAYDSLKRSSYFRRSENRANTVPADPLVRQKANRISWMHDSLNPDTEVIAPLARSNVDPKTRYHHVPKTAASDYLRTTTPLTKEARNTLRLSMMTEMKEPLSVLVTRPGGWEEQRLSRGSRGRRVQMLRSYVEQPNGGQRSPPISDAIRGSRCIQSRNRLAPVSKRQPTDCHEGTQDSDAKATGRTHRRQLTMVDVALATLEGRRDSEIERAEQLLRLEEEEQQQRQQDASEAATRRRELEEEERRLETCNASHMNSNESDNNNNNMPILILRKDRHCDESCQSPDQVPATRHHRSWHPTRCSKTLGACDELAPRFAFACSTVRADITVRRVAAKSMPNTGPERKPSLTTQRGRDVTCAPCGGDRSSTHRIHGREEAWDMAGETRALCVVEEVIDI
ncbi:hypothetical protein BJ546DRAFT_1050605 [Cryomyces antarcticus]